MQCGDTLLNPAPGFGNTHLWVIVTEPDPLCIIVSLTTLRFSRDQTVVLNVGDHPFIRHETAVLYSDARIVDVSLLEAEVKAGTAQIHKSCPSATLKLIQDGITASPHTARKVETFYKARKSAG